MNPRPKILVMLSSYNGERYLARQLDSILGQTDVEVTILIRDDGSSDGTRDILVDYAGKYERIKVLQAQNIGWADSFAELMRIAERDYFNQVDYFAFADQDDFWFPEKLHTACGVLAKEVRPALYHSNVWLADRELVKGDLLFDERNGMHTFQTALIDAGILGCTEVMNKTLLKLSNLLLRDKKIPSHDRMVLLIAHLLGEVVYDNTAHMLYRQHGHNACGGVRTEMLGLLSRFRLMIRNRHVIRDHAKILYDGYLKHQGNDAFRIAPEKLEALKVFVEYPQGVFSRMRLLLHWDRLGFNRSAFGDNRKKRLKIMIGCI